MTNTIIGRKKNFLYLKDTTILAKQNSLHYTEEGE